MAAAVTAPTSASDPAVVISQVTDLKSSNSPLTVQENDDNKTSSSAIRKFTFPGGRMTLDNRCVDIIFNEEHEPEFISNINDREGAAKYLANIGVIEVNISRELVCGDIGEKYRYHLFCDYFLGYVAYPGVRLTEQESADSGYANFDKGSVLEEMFIFATGLLESFL